MRILAFSSSRVGNGGYLEIARPVIHDFLGDQPLQVAFIPFASVDADYESYTDMVRAGLSSLPYKVNTVKPGNAIAVIGQSDVIMTGGGNTFKLLHDLYEQDLLELIQSKVKGGTPYIGWSAGSNITGLGIGTTNDMPVIMPQSFKALAFLPFQLNPHYFNFKPEGFNGETRDQRLMEFMKMNPDLPIVGLPEGTALKLDNRQLHYIGLHPGALFHFNHHENVGAKRTIEPGEDLSFLLNESKEL